jgi:hypothetical protein
MARKQISDLVEATLIGDDIYFAGEDGISSKKIKAKTLQDYLRLLLYINYYTTTRAAADIAITDLFPISSTGNNATQKTTFANIISAINRLNLISVFPALAAADIAVGDLLPIGDISAANATKKITVANLLTFLQSTTGKMMTTNLSNGVKTTQALVNALMPDNMDYVVSRSGNSSNMYIKFKSGLIIQWLIVYGGFSNEKQTATFLTPFTVAPLLVIPAYISFEGTSNNPCALIINSTTTTTFTIGNKLTTTWGYAVCLAIGI